MRSIDGSNLVLIIPIEAVGGRAKQMLEGKKKEKKNIRKTIRSFLGKRKDLKNIRKTIRSFPCRGKTLKKKQEKNNKVFPRGEERP